ncbi:hypothetical protein SAMN05192529_11439 [Arachidicoccus rhizosphaerae]|uniref:Uncharacterized protein n=1 Tax=Arachidicoccus rhizosphaerae TaxID=551991 RepID=A0A1H4AD85_9BACT|nr:hypothetical protein SAMN05192529_11439 [Arachidicoccus rhizosphaerae]
MVIFPLETNIAEMLQEVQEIFLRHDIDFCQMPKNKNGQAGFYHHNINN